MQFSLSQISAEIYCYFGNDGGLAGPLSRIGYPRPAETPSRRAGLV